MDEYQKILNCILENGGATVLRETTELITFDAGYQVSYKDGERIIGSTTFTSCNIEQYIEDNVTAIEEGRYFGFWIHKGELYADICTHKATITEAVEMATTHEQIAIWDWSVFDEITIADITP
tara:strand:+ start:1287 stop:1655 length:369 start_codon:yes stop_codon:yes gene_type:complete